MSSVCLDYDNLYSISNQIGCIVILSALYTFSPLYFKKTKSNLNKLTIIINGCISFTSLTTSSALFIKVNANNNFINCNTQPSWLTPYWIYTEVLFITACFTFIIVYLLHIIYISYENMDIKIQLYENSRNNESNENNNNLLLKLTLIISKIVIIFNFFVNVVLVFGLCDPGNC